MHGGKGTVCLMERQSKWSLGKSSVEIAAVSETAAVPTNLFLIKVSAA